MMPNFTLRMVESTALGPCAHNFDKGNAVSASPDIATFPKSRPEYMEASLSEKRPTLRRTVTHSPVLSPDWTVESLPEFVCECNRFQRRYAPRFCYEYSCADDTC
jgi:hypothetical protein